MEPVVHLYCLKCKTSYSIPFSEMKEMTYREYSYCNDCYKTKENTPEKHVG